MKSYFMQSLYSYEEKHDTFYVYLLCYNHKKSLNCYNSKPEQKNGNHDLIHEHL